MHMKALNSLAKSIVGLMVLALYLSTNSTAFAQDRPVLVKTAIVEPAPNGTDRSFFGKVAARQSVDLGFQVAGRIMTFTAPEGELVREGEVIAELDQTPFQIEADRALLAKQQADRTVARYEKLAGATISEAQVLDAQTNARIAAVALESAEYALGQSTLRAPFDALIATRAVGNYSTVAAGTQVVRLLDLSELRVEIRVPETLVQVLGDDPDVELSARFPGSEDSYPLAFKEANAETSEVGQTFQVTLAMQAPIDRLLLPGASVTVDARFKDLSAGIAIAPSSIGMDASGQTFVMQLIADGDEAFVKRVPVSLSVSPSGEIEVLSGVGAGAEIVTSGVNVLTDGQAVRRFVHDFD